MCTCYYNFKPRFIIFHIIIIGGADVTDHVPVDDNPAYITMKEITLNKNSAYETVTVNNTSAGL